jgi:imidazolonepropionase-like amidohydrolase
MRTAQVHNLLVPAQAAPSPERHVHRHVHAQLDADQLWDGIGVYRHSWGPVLPEKPSSILAHLYDALRPSTTAEEPASSESGRRMTKANSSPWENARRNSREYVPVWRGQRCPGSAVGRPSEVRSIRESWRIVELLGRLRAALERHTVGFERRGKRRGVRTPGTLATPRHLEFCMNKIFELVLVCAAPVLVLAQTKQNTQPKALVFTHVIVIDATGAPAKPDMTIVIVGDRIAELGPTKKARVPKDAQVVDAAGKFLIPGLWDMHIHLFMHPPSPPNTHEGLSMPIFPMSLANGVTGLREMTADLEDLKQIEQWRVDMAQGKLLGPHIRTASASFEGAHPASPSSLRVADEAQGRALVRTYTQAGADSVKVYGTLSRNVYFAIVDEARRLRIPVVGHVPSSISAAEASDAGQRSIEHLTRVWHDASTPHVSSAAAVADPDPQTSARLKSVLFNIANGDPGFPLAPDEPFVLTRQGRGFVMWVRTTSELGELASGGEVKSFDLLESGQSEGERVYRYRAVVGSEPLEVTFRVKANGKIDFSADDHRTYDERKATELFERFRRNATWQCPTLQSWLMFNGNYAGDSRAKYLAPTMKTFWDFLLREHPPADIRYFQQYGRNLIKLVGVMQKQGVQILPGTDDYRYLGFNLHDELALFVEAGLTPMEALQTATRNPAMFFGMEKDLGTIEKGKMADLVLLDANPLDDIHNSQKIAAVVLGGRFLSRLDLDRMLADVETLMRDLNRRTPH